MNKFFNMFTSLFLILSWPVFSDMIDDLEEIDEIVVPEKKAPSEKKSKTPSSNKGTVSKPSEAKKSSQTDSEQKSKKKTERKNKDSSKKPIHLKSDGDTTISRNSGEIKLVKNVVITQDELRLQADRATVVMDESDKENKIQKVEVDGHVKVSKFYEDPSEKITAFGDKAFFYNKDQKVKLIGNGSSALEIMVYFFLDVPDWSVELKQRGAIYLQILKKAEDMGISFAFPTRTLHIEGSMPNELSPEA